jgi:hypothetical protein
MSCLGSHREPQARAARPKNSISSQLQIGLSIAWPPRFLPLRSALLCGILLFTASNSSLYLD